MIAFENPIACLLFLLIILYRVIKKTSLRKITFNFSILDWNINKKIKSRNIMFSISQSLFKLSIAVLILALMKPKFISHKTVFINNEASIMFLLDVSPSMSITDMKINGEQNISRLQVAKDTIKGFVLKHKNISVGLTLFATNCSLVIPETLHQKTFFERLEKTAIGELGDGTALGDGMATALLHSRRDKNSYIIVLTDGENNSGTISPMTVAEIIAKRKINFYIIGIGSIDGGEIKYSNDDASVTYYGKHTGRFDEAKLKALALKSNGSYKFVGSYAELNISFDDIHKNLAENILQEKVTENYSLQNFFILTALCFLVTAWCIKKIILRIIL